MKQVTVTVDDEHLATIEDLVAELTRRGMSVEQVSDVTGTLVVRVEDPDVLHGIEGVISVEVSESFEIAPPDSAVQ